MARTLSKKERPEGFTTIGERLYPDVRNVTGHVLDLMKKQAR